MADKVTNYQCPACTGPLHFDSTTGKLVCDYCGSAYEVADIEAQYAQKQQKADAAAASDERRLRPAVQKRPAKTRSGAKRRPAAFPATPAPPAARSWSATPPRRPPPAPTAATPPCWAASFPGKLKPEYILPFKMDKNAAIAQLTKYYKGKAFLPKAFKSQNHIAEIQGVYVPFWLFDAEADARGSYDGQVSESHREGDYRVTTTQHYDVRREGTATFARVPVDGSSKMPDEHMDSIEPFDYSELKPFSTAYLPGFLADRYDEDAKTCADRAKTRIENSTAEALRQTLSEYAVVDTREENINVRMKKRLTTPLLPVWMLHTRWKEQDFLFAMNGQTGRLIGDLPVDKGRVAAWFARIALPLMAILIWLLYL